MPDVSTFALSAGMGAPLRLPPLPDRYPIWIGYDPAEGHDQAIVVEITERGGRFLASVPAAAVAEAVALAKGAAR